MTDAEALAALTAWTDEPPVDGPDGHDRFFQVQYSAGFEEKWEVCLFLRDAEGTRLGVEFPHTVDSFRRATLAEAATAALDLYREHVARLAGA